MVDDVLKAYEEGYKRRFPDEYDRYKHRFGEAEIVSLEMEYKEVSEWVH